MKDQVEKTVMLNGDGTWAVGWFRRRAAGDFRHRDRLIRQLSQKSPSIRLCTYEHSPTRVVNGSEVLGYHYPHVSRHSHESY